MSELQIRQNKAAKVLLGHPPRSSSTEALRSLDLKSLSARRFFNRCIAIYKCLIEETDLISSKIKLFIRITQDVPMIFAYPFLELTGEYWGKQTFIYHAARDWNSLPTDLKETHFLSIFKSKLKTF